MSTAADDGILHMAAVIDSYAVHEHRVDDFDIGAQAAVGSQHGALHRALVSQARPAANHAG